MTHVTQRVRLRCNDMKGRIVKKKLDFDVYCHDCKVECNITDLGITCNKCGAFISDEQLELGY